MSGRVEKGMSSAVPRLKRIYLLFQCYDSVHNLAYKIKNHTEKEIVDISIITKI